MQTWTNGYVADIAYTYGFYRELTPALLNFALLAKGQKTQDLASPLTYCELGCGQGFSANLLAAANPQIEFHATDFNPTQIAGARALAAAAGTSNVHFYDTAFADFADAPGLPESFDFITLHGIYSWISEENRQHIVDFIAKKLKVGGIVYISYNTLPGWAALMPVRRLFVDQATKGSGPIVPRIDAALAFADALQKIGAGYFVQNPVVGQRLERMASMSRNYLAHEYFNRDWTPFYFADVAAEMSRAKLTFGGSVHLLDHIDAFSLTDDQRKIMALETDPMRRETLYDFLVNQQFRRDVYQKGPLSHTLPSARSVWLDTRFALSSARDKIPLTAPGRFGEIKLHEAIYVPILDMLAKGPASLRQLTADKAIADLGWAKVTEALRVLVGLGNVQPSLAGKDEAKRAQRCRAFNLAVCKQAEENADLQFLASPVTGGGVPVDRLEQLFLLALSQGRKEPQQWIDFTWQVLSSQDQKLIKEGKPLETEEENRAELSSKAENFAKERLPVFKSLQITT